MKRLLQLYNAPRESRKYKHTKVKKDTAKKRNFILQISLLFFLIIFIIATIVLPYIYTFDDVHKLNIDVTVGDYVGVNVDTDAVHFGTLDLTKIRSAKRTIVLENNKAAPRLVTLFVSGKISDWISLSENNFIMDNNENKTVEVMINIPSDTPKGTYTGLLTTNFKKLASKNEGK